MSWLAPWALWGLVLVPAVMLFRLLVPPAPRVVVSWLRPWQQFLKAGGGRGRWWPRLKSLALWLDLAILVLLVLTVARPFTVTELSDEPVLRLLVDRSATMAIPGPDGQSRWSAALKMLEGFVKDVPADAAVEAITVPAAHQDAEVVQLRAGEVMKHFSQLEPILKFAKLQWAVERFAPPAEVPVVLVTDAFPEADLGEQVFVLATGAMGQKGVALTKAAGRIEGDRWFVLVALRNGADLQREVLLSIEPVGAEKRTETVAMEPDERWEQVFEMSGLPPDAVRIVADTSADNFPADNEAYLVREVSRRVRVAIVGKSDVHLRRALVSAGDVEIVEAASVESIEPASADLTIFSAALPPGEWPGDACFVNPPADVGPINVKNAELLDGEEAWVVQSSDVGLGRWLYLPGPVAMRLKDVVLTGPVAIVVGTEERPVIVAWEDEDKNRRVAVLFDISTDATDWPATAGYPIFWAGVVSHLIGEKGRPSQRDRLYVTHRPYEAEWDRATPGFIRADDGRIVAGISFIGDDKWRLAPPVDQSREAAEAVKAMFAKFAGLGRRELWPLFAAACAALALVRLFAGGQVRLR